MRWAIVYFILFIGIVLNIVRKRERLKESGKSKIGMVIIALLVVAFLIMDDLYFHSLSFPVSLVILLVAIGALSWVEFSMLNHKQDQ